MNVTFTAADVVAQVRALAAERPDYVYPGADNPRGCSYVDDDLGSGKGQGCLIGQALQRLGVPRDWLREHGDWSPGDNGGVTASVLLSHLEVAEDYTASRFLNTVQMHQDGGEPWRLAVEAAERAAGRVS